MIKQLKKQNEPFYPKIALDSIVFPDGQNLNAKLASKQDVLISGTNIKTVNNKSILGNGNIEVASPKSVLNIQIPADGTYTLSDFRIVSGITDATFLRAISDEYTHVKVIPPSGLFNITDNIYPIVVTKSKNSNISEGSLNGMSIITEDKIICISRRSIRNEFKYVVSTILLDSSDKQDVIDSDNKLDYSLIDNAPEISTSVSDDASSDTKTVSPKAVKTYVDSQLETSEYVTASALNDLNDRVDVLENDDTEHVSNKVTSISGSSTDTQYPSAKLVYDQFSNVQRVYTGFWDLEDGYYPFINFSGTPKMGDILFVPEESFLTVDYSPGRLDIYCNKVEFRQIQQLEQNTIYSYIEIKLHTSDFNYDLIYTIYVNENRRLVVKNETTNEEELVPTDGINRVVIDRPYDYNGLSAIYYEVGLEPGVESIFNILSIKGFNFGGYYQYKPVIYANGEISESQCEWCKISYGSEEVTGHKAFIINSDSTDEEYPSAKAVYTALSNKQDTLVSGTNIKTINGNSILGTGDITLSGGGGGTSITVDSSLSASSENPVQNKVINNALSGKQDTIDSTHKLDYSLVDNTPTIPTVPTISTDVASDKTSDTKTTSPKAVYSEIHPAKGSSQPAGGLLPNVFYNLGELTGSVTISLASATDSTIENEYKFRFSTGNSAPTITWPNTITGWLGGTTPTINANKTYWVAINDGLAIIGEF